MLQFSTVDPARPDVIALCGLPEVAGASELWSLEPRRALSLRAAAGCGISYNVNGMLLQADGQTLADLKSLRVLATNRVSGQGAPLFYTHSVRGDGEVKVYRDGSLVPADQWLLDNGQVYLAEPGSWRLEVGGSEEKLDLRPVLPSWPSLTLGPSRALRVAVIDQGDKRIVTAQLDADLTSPALELRCDVQPAWVEVTDSQIQLYTLSSDVPNAVLQYSASNLGAIADALSSVPNWSAKVLGSPGFASHASAGGTSFIVPLGLTAVPEGGAVQLSSRAIWWRSEPTHPFTVSILATTPQNPWPLLVGSGHLLTRCTLNDADRTYLGSCLDAVVTAQATAEWSVVESRLRATPQGSSMYWENVPAWCGEPQETEEDLAPVDSTGRNWQTSRQQVSEVLELRIAGVSYPDAVESFDSARGVITTRFAAQAVRARYRYYSDAVELYSFTHPITGQRTEVELNPRLDLQRYQSRLVVLTPSRLTLTLTRSGENYPYSLVNASPLRVVATSAPYDQLRQLDDHWSTQLLAGAQMIKLPYHVLAIAHYTPLLNPAQATNVSRLGGVLRTNLSDAELERLSPQTRGWEALTARKAYQLSQTLVLHLPMRLQEKYGEAEVRQRCARVLPAATFFAIEWY